MSINEITGYKDKLLVNLRLHGEYDEAAGIKNNTLLVEGSTDKAFMQHIKSNDTKVISVASFMKDQSSFSTSGAPETKYNSKRIIYELMKHISWIPEMIQCPKGADKWPLYGLIDRDFDNVGDCSRLPKLFMTDTHDLETLMLSTDEGLLSRLKQCSIPDEDLQKALYLSVQLAAYRKAIQQNGVLDLADINESDGTVNFDAFTSAEYMIDLSRLLSYINSKSEKPLSKEKLSKAHRAIADSMKRLLDKDGKWKKPLESFAIDPDGKLWKEVNGHDVLSAIRFVNIKARAAFDNRDGYQKNRDFELALVDAYNYGSLKETELFSKMKEAGLLREFDE